MQRTRFYTALLSGAMVLGTMGFFHHGANALDLGEFTGADRKVITEEAPKRGGIALYKEVPVSGTVTTAPPRAVVVQGRAQPVLTGASYNAINPAAGVPDVAPDTSNDPSDPFAGVRARLNTPGIASGPVDGKPLVTADTADGQRVRTLNEIAPAAGISAAASTEPSPFPAVRTQSKMYNN